MRKPILTESELSKATEYRLAPFIYGKVKEHNTSLGDNPSFPDTSEHGYDYEVLKKRLKEIMDLSECHLGLGKDDEKRAMELLSEKIHECRELEAPNRQRLEKICYNSVNRLLAVPQGTVDFKCVIVDEVSTDSEMRIYPDKTDIKFKDTEHKKYIDEEIAKRRMIDAIIQGGAYVLSDADEETISELDNINPRLPRLYGEIRLLNDYLLFTHEEVIDDRNPMQGAYVEVDLGKQGEKTVIQSQAIIFPMLLQESIRGFLELITSHGLPEDIAEAMYVIRNADFILAEPWDLRLGVNIYRDVFGSIQDTRLLPYVMSDICGRSPSEFTHIIKEKLSGTETGDSIISALSDKYRHDADYQAFKNRIDQKNAEQSIITDSEHEGWVMDEGSNVAGTDHPYYRDEETGQVWAGDYGDSDSFAFGYFPSAVPADKDTELVFSIGGNGSWHYDAVYPVVKAAMESEGDGYAYSDADHLYYLLMDLVNDGVTVNPEDGTFVTSDGEEFDLDAWVEETVDDMYTRDEDVYGVVNELCSQAIRNGQVPEFSTIEAEFTKLICSDFPEDAGYEGKDLKAWFTERGYDFYSHYYDYSRFNGRIFLDCELIGFYEGEEPDVATFKDILYHIADDSEIGVSYEDLMEFHVVYENCIIIEEQKGCYAHYNLVFLNTVQEYLNNNGKPSDRQVIDAMKKEGVDYDPTTASTSSAPSSVSTTKPKHKYIEHLAKAEDKWKQLKDFRDTRDRVIYQPREKAAGTLAQYHAMRYPYSESVIDNRELITEDKISRNMKPAKRYLRSLGYNDEKTIYDVLTKVRAAIPSCIMSNTRYILGLTRMYMKGQLSDANTRDEVNTVIAYIANNHLENEVDRDLNGWSAKELVSKFIDAVNQRTSAERAKRRGVSYRKNPLYTIERIDSFDQATEYADYVDWCVTQEEDYYDEYTENSPFYFCLKKGWDNFSSPDNMDSKEVDEVTGKDYPLDDYGLSMIAVTVRRDGSPNTITCRWNVGIKSLELDQNHVMTADDVEEILGVNFYETFLPYSPELQAIKDKEIEERKRQEALAEERNEERRQNAQAMLDAGENPKDVFDFYHEDNGGRDGMPLIITVYIGRLCNYYNVNENRLLLDEWANAALTFSKNGLASFVRNGESFIINTEGKILMRGTSLHPMNNHPYITGKIGNEWYIYDLNGKAVAGPFGLVYDDGKGTIEVHDAEGRRNFLDANMKPLLPRFYKWIEKFDRKNNIFIVQDDEKMYSILDVNGNNMFGDQRFYYVDHIYSDTELFEDGKPISVTFPDHSKNLALKNGTYLFDKNGSDVGETHITGIYYMRFGSWSMTSRNTTYMLHGLNKPCPFQGEILNDLRQPGESYIKVDRQDNRIYTIRKDWSVSGPSMFW